MRGIALIFLVGGLLMVAAALAAFLTRSYRTLSAQYETAPETSEADAGPPATGGIPSSSREAAGGVAGE